MGSILERRDFPRKPIRDFIDILSLEQLFVFQMLNEDNKYFLTFNLDREKIGTKLQEIKKMYSSIFRIHRKIKHKSFFTINALEGLDENFAWKDYGNSLILKGRDGKINIFQLKLLDIINLK